ncbi:VOC family protein [Psychrobacillus sp. NPDC058041]|uniref:VOC family protein n=1 Tax=Psychrobacillus sp. NPDC058041 TaxID=3346310 RepID=UPI0036D81461
MTQPLLIGMEGIFIPISDPKISAQWYEDKLGFKLIYIENEAAVMKISDVSQTVVCLVRSINHQPMKFPENNFGVGKYYNFISKDIEETHKLLLERDVQVNSIGGDGTTKFFTFYDPDGNPLGVCQ